jgi:DNA polymerase elongation subunit (family B)
LPIYNLLPIIIGTTIFYLNPLLANINIRNILFLDIETVPQCRSHEELSPVFSDLWKKKCATFRIDPPETPDIAYHRAGIYAEFGKVICISCGCFSNNDEFHIKSYYGHDEKKILTDFSEMLNRSYNSTDKLLCAHNGKEFDFPFLCRRMLINGLPLPGILNIAVKKPWELMHLDTMELWKFGDYKSYTTLNLLCAVFDIPTPKDDIDGSMVGKVYWEDDDIERIVKYCRKDVITIAQIFRKFRNEELFELADR